jgi:[ribosomal protein S5]-alanine N-acetyltransferase
MTVIFESNRLLFRLFTMDDAELIYQLNADPEVTRFTFDPMHSIEQATRVLEQTILPQYALYNYGRWAVHLKHDLSFIGWCGLKYRREQNEVDLGYRFARHAWGKGYATEAAFASLRYGLDKLGLQRIVGRAVVGNLASLHVLEKCNMKYIGEEVIDGHLHRTYEKLV